MASETILQNWVIAQFALPFLLIFFITFGIMEKSKLFGDNKKQLHALIAFVIGLIFILIAIFSPFLIPVATLLALLGIFGGTFIISFDTFIQSNSLEGKRGQTIAAANFLSFFGVLLASLYLYISGDLFGLSAANTFFCMGILTLLISVFLSLSLLEVFLPFLARHSSFYKKIPIVDPFHALENGSLFILEEGSLPLLWTIYRHSQRNNLILLSEKDTFFLKLLGLIPSIHFLSSETLVEGAIRKAKSLQKEDLSLCIILNKSLPEDIHRPTFSFFPFKEETAYLVKLHTSKEKTLSIGISAL